MYVAAKSFPHLNRRYRLGDEVKPEDFPTEESFQHFISIGLIEDRSPPAAIEPETPPAPAA